MRKASLFLSVLILMPGYGLAQVAIRPKAEVTVDVPPGQVTVAGRWGRAAVAWPAAQIAVAWPPQKDFSLEDLISGAKGGSYLGVGVEEVDSERAKELKLREERGVEIRRVDHDSPAEKAGLKEHDVVLEYNGQRVEGVESFTRMVRETPVGRSAKLVVSRDGNTQTLTATIGRRKGPDYRSFTFPTPPALPMPPMIEIPRALTTTRTPRMGVETESLGGQLADFFGVKEGVLVRSVDKDSPADKAGIKAGDIIVKVDGQRVRQPRELSEELRSSRDKKTIPLQVVRNKKEMTLNLELPDRADREIRRGVRVRQERL